MPAAFSSGSCERKMSRMWLVSIRPQTYYRVVAHPSAGELLAVACSRRLTSNLRLVTNGAARLQIGQQIGMFVQQAKQI